MELAFEATFIVDFDSGCILDANRAAAVLLGYSTEELRGMRGRDLHPASSGPAIDRVSTALREAGEHFEPRLAVLRKDGTQRWCEMRLHVRTVADRKLIIAAQRDITEAYEKETRHATLVEAASDAILVSDFDSAKFVQVNAAAREMFGFDEEEFYQLKGRQLHPAEAGADVDAITAQLNASGKAWNPGTLLHHKDGTRFYGDVCMTGYELFGQRRYVTIIRDVSERIEQGRQLNDSLKQLRETQAQLVQASKMSAMGALGAGIAHELNQPLTIITGFMQRILRRPQRTIGETQSTLDLILDEARRMARIVDNVRTFGRQGDALVMEPVAAIAPLQNALLLIRTQLSNHHIELIEEHDAELPDVRGDAGKLQQVFLNLVMNARDALEEHARSDASTITTEVYADGDDVVYAVTDSGPGVPADVQPHLFDPFFTTKAPDKGTGLGLSISYQIIAEHGGSLTYVDSDPRGARFEVRLPRVQPDGARAEHTAAQGVHVGVAAAADRAA